MINKKGIIKNNVNRFATVYRLVDVVIIQLALLLSVQIYSAPRTDNLIIASLVSVIGFSIFAEALRLYRSWRGEGFFKEIAFYTVLSWLLSFTVVMAYAFFSKTSVDFSRVMVAIWFVLTTFLLVFWRWCFMIFLQLIRSKGYNTRSVCVIGLTEQGMQLVDQILEHPETGFRLKTIYDDRSRDRIPDKYQKYLSGNINDGIALAKENEFEIVFIALPLTAEQRISNILNALGNTTANVQLVPNVFMYSFVGAHLSYICGIQTISVFNNPMSGVQGAIKRLEDIILSLLILSVIALPMLLIAMAVKLTSKGPVIFKQDRYGLDGRKIKVWKFRSMTVTENDAVVTQATKNDSRLTRIGGFLRRTSLDELPQFINVLQGRMSVVGPRPHAVSHNEYYRNEVDFYMIRHKVKPGITGWAQVNGYRGETDTVDKMEMRVQYDLDYIRRWSLWLDLKVVFMTISKSFVDKNAY